MEVFAMAKRVKRAVLIAFTMIILAVTLAVSASAATIQATANTPVRVKAKSSSTKITTMKKGSTRTVLKVSGNWIKIKVNGKTGYVNKNRVKYVTESKKESAAEKEEVVTTKEDTTTAAEKMVKLGTFKITYYGDDTITASGKTPQLNHTVAVDPRVIPLGTKIYIEGMGIYYAEDTGGAVKGNILDVFVRTEREANQLGIKYATVYIYQ
jgi:3D (Asp-Asp-Asp) domain-containing protein